MKKDYVYDVEVFPNFFSVTFLHVDTSITKSFVIFEDRDDRAELIKFLNRNPVLIGYNNIFYDGVVLTYIKSNMDKDVTAITKSIYRLSQDIINEQNTDHVKKLRFNTPWKQLDLMKVLAFDKLGIGLKQVAINLKWHRIQDLPLPYDQPINASDVENILDYNLNDVLITNELHKSIAAVIDLRKKLGDLFGIDLRNASDSKMANLILEKIYTKETNTSIEKLVHLRTKRKTVRVSDCIPIINFKTEKLIKLREELSKIELHVEDGFKYEKSINISGTTFDLGVGGIHSRDLPGIFESNEDSAIRDADVASYYPNIMLNHKIKPEHLGNDFLRILKKITTERLDAKRNGDDIKASGLKITINSIFGKLASDTFWLEDPKAMLTVTLSGQLYVLLLIEALSLNGIKTISANTDGIICIVPKKLEQVYSDVCKEWESTTNFQLEFTDYRKYIRLDVNNYIAVTLKGKVKEKGRGRFSRETALNKGYKYPIVPKCLHEYFVNNKSFDDTLNDCRDILDFCMSQKSASKFKLELQRGLEKASLQKNNRFFISNDGGILVKRNTDTNQELRLVVGYVSTILNDYDANKSFDEYNVNINYYRKEVRKIIDMVIPPPIPQLTLF